ncbi:MAG: hypothetical protein WC641_05620 [Patescibacteria group bacterium]
MTQPKSHVLSPEDAVWLERLESEIWKKHIDDPHNPSETTWYDETRKLTPEEFERLKMLILEYELPCEPGGGTFGFGFSLYVFNHPPSSGMKPQGLIRITGGHLEIEPGHKNWGKIWDTFEPFTHSARNKELLAAYGMEAPRGRKHYEY